ncbi:MAG: hypothetical protein ABSA18_16250 [Dehalococcoidia bacterium]
MGFCLWLPLVFLFSNTRDTNLYLIILFIPLLLLTIISTKIRILFIVSVSIALLAFALIQNYQSNITKRWEYPLINIIYQRILVSDININYFASMGMPIDNGILKMKGSWAGNRQDSLNHLVIPVKILAEHENYIYIRQDFKEWLDHKGMKTYISFLMQDPVKNTILVINSLPNNFDNEIIRNYGPGGAFNGGNGKQLGHFSQGLDNIFFFKILHPWWWLFLLILVPIIMLQLMNPKDKLIAAIALITVVACYSQAFIAYYGDAMEIERHSLMANYLFRICVLFTLLLVYYFTKYLLQARYHVSEGRMQDSKT